MRVNICIYFLVVSHYKHIPCMGQLLPTIPQLDQLAFLLPPDLLVVHQLKPYKLQPLYYILMDLIISINLDLAIYMLICSCLHSLLYCLILLLSHPLLLHCQAYGFNLHNTSLLCTSGFWSLLIFSIYCGHWSSLPHIQTYKIGLKHSYYRHHSCSFYTDAISQSY